jgi:hypothetical protein
MGVAFRPHPIITPPQQNNTDRSILNEYTSANPSLAKHKITSTHPSPVPYLYTFPHFSGEGRDGVALSPPSSPFLV